jgi:hypothetical protein
MDVDVLKRTRQAQARWWYLLPLDQVALEPSVEFKVQVEAEAVVADFAACGQFLGKQ